ncbi:MAG: hypothetical protein M1832_005863 [Thelocarpon impressellum]|nr:MAG: hypothetical protein M1832_005863 [Thelocarpon impressellum]
MAKRSREESPSASPDPSSPVREASVGAEQVWVPSTKYAHVDDDGAGGQDPGGVMRCSLPPHQQTLQFTSYEAYDVHYAQTHVNRCSECRGNFPTAHFLELHICENHDPLTAVRRERGEKTYGCLVEDCDRVCSSPEKRRRHLIDKHMFPKEYDFSVVDDGIDRRSSMLRSRGHRRTSSAAVRSAAMEQRARRRSAAMQGPAERGPGGPVDGGAHPVTRPSGSAPQDSMEGSADDGSSDAAASPPAGEAEVGGGAVLDEEVGGLADSMAALRFVPPSVRFGRGKRGGLGTR